MTVYFFFGGGGFLSNPVEGDKEFCYECPTKRKSRNFLARGASTVRQGVPSESISVLPRSDEL